MSTEEQRQKFTEVLTENEDWLYMEGDTEVAAEYRRRLKALRALGDPMFWRAQETEMRPQVMGARLPLITHAVMHEVLFLLNRA